MYRENLTEHIKQRCAQHSNIINFTLYVTCCNHGACKGRKITCPLMANSSHSYIIKNWTGTLRE